MPEPHPAFAPDNPYLQIAWDATSLELFMRDPWTYYCTIIEGWRTPLPSAALFFGSLYHESCGYYCYLRLAGADHDEALDGALIHAIEWAAAGAEVPGTPGERVPLDELAANSMRRGDGNTRDTYRLLRAVVWWCDLYGNDPLYQTINLPSGRPAIEVHFDFPLGFKLGDHDARLCGHLDGIVRAETGELIVREWKHTTATIGGDRSSAARYFLRYKPNVQINTYALAGKLLLPSEPVRGVLIEACQTAVTFAHFEREWIDRPEPAINEWIGCINYQVERAHDLAITAKTLANAGCDPSTPYAMAQNPATMRQYGASIFADAAFRLPNLRRPYLASRAVVSERWDPTAARDIIE
jgi:hypothetical protein